MYFDPPQPRLLNSILTIGLTMQVSRKFYGVDGHILVCIVAIHCYWSSSNVRHIGLHVIENDKIDGIGKWVANGDHQCVCENSTIPI